MKLCFTANVKQTIIVIPIKVHSYWYWRSFKREITQTFLQIILERNTSEPIYLWSCSSTEIQQNLNTWHKLALNPNINLRFERSPLSVTQKHSHTNTLPEIGPQQQFLAMHARLVYPVRKNLLDFHRVVLLVAPGLDEI